MQYVLVLVWLLGWSLGGFVLANAQLHYQVIEGLMMVLIGTVAAVGCGILGALEVRS